VSVRVAQARVLVAERDALATVARVMQITRQALYRVAKPGTAPRCCPPADGSLDAVIVEVAKANPADGYRIVTAWVARKLGRAVNRKRVLREQKLIQRRGREPKRRRPGFSKVERPGQLWHRLLHPRDRRLGALASPSRRRGDRGDRDRGVRTPGRSTRSWASVSAMSRAPRAPGS
jgi:hypothetical protein